MEGTVKLPDTQYIDCWNLFYTNPKMDNPCTVWVWLRILNICRCLFPVKHNDKLHLF